MKRLFKYFMFTLFVGLIFCNVAFSAPAWSVANKAQITWNPVTKLIDGTSVPTGNIIEYNVYITTDVTKSPTNLTKLLPLPTSDTTTGNTTYTITFTKEGSYYIGVSAVRKFTIDGGAVSLEGGIGWSDAPEATPVPFGVRYYIQPGNTTGISLTK